MVRPRSTNAGGNRSGTGSRVIKTITLGRPQVVAPPPVDVNHVRCSVCRNTTKLTQRGYLRRHRDLFGHVCYNVAPEVTP